MYIKLLDIYIKWDNLKKYDSKYYFSNFNFV